MSRWKVRVRDDGFNGTKDVLIIHDHFGDTMEIIRFSYEQHNKSDLIQDPTFTDSRIDREDNVSLFQALVDAAWENGYRPNGMKDLTETLRMKDAHLQDMRDISRHLLKMTNK